MSAEQNYSNHGRLDPPMHLFIFPVLILNVGLAIWVTVERWPEHQHAYLYLWWIVVSFAMLLFALKTRMNDVKLQDRIIRLEERLRIASLVPANELGHLQELSVKQLVALRFAADEELPALVHKTLTQELEPKAIKQSITHWRADHHRV
ncbi:DUF6526 family protein [Edaphobacter modestus]|uniref:Uncharacterized protein n=1 Tax=Edaphobacter modestus TaxID=388466 RepID=A0A4Q7Z0D9_9BACT|nr:DUF6526 family protein [Edaphobacter modestus]RZU42925.1 hypothetical protein BDD14_4526 [Edaphobacter modestus]